MTPHQTVAVALRLFAVWLGLQALITLPAFFADKWSNSPVLPYALFLLTLTVVLILVMWFFPRAITGKILPPRDAHPQTTATPDTWLAMGCSLIGLWVFTVRAPRLVLDGYIQISMMSSAEHSQLVPGFLFDVMEVAIALWLILGGKGFRKIFWWVQNVGIRKDL